MNIILIEKYSQMNQEEITKNLGNILKEIRDKNDSKAR